MPSRVAPGGEGEEQSPEKFIGHHLYDHPLAKEAIEGQPRAIQCKSGLQVAWVGNAYAKEVENVELTRVLHWIFAGKYAHQIYEIRQLFAAWKQVCPGLDNKDSAEAKAYDACKRKLPAFCVSGTARSRTEPLKHSNLLQVDCDHLGERLPALRAQFKEDRHIAFGFRSPGGDGLKLGLAIDGQRHAESFEAAARHFRERYGVEIDPKVKDPLRLCFVSHDPEGWTRGDAEPLPIPEGQPAAPDASELSVTDGFDGTRPLIILPSGPVSISKSARQIFQCVQPGQQIFWRGGALVELTEQEGVSNLEVVRADAFRSRVERYGAVVTWRRGADGKGVLKPTRMSRDEANALMATSEARELLPPVANVLRCPVLVETGAQRVTLMGQGYHEVMGGLLIVAGDMPPKVPLAEAVAALKWLVEEFHFQSAGDQSRALAAFLLPALRLGGFLKDAVPIDVAEADQSQSGKGYRHNLVCALFNESSYFVTARNGGVGSTDESLAAALIAGRPFIRLDNFRGKLDSQHLEAFLTCPDLFPARIPHRGEVQVNPRRFLLQMSSNGLEATRDLANRASICRIRKRPGYRYRDTLGEVRQRQAYYLGCVFAVVREWVAQGKPRSDDTRHDFREWCQTLDWIVRQILGCAPLMDDHPAAQDRVSTPALSWLRSVALALESAGQLGQPLTASGLVELCGLHALEIPGLKQADEELARRQVGVVMRRAFGDKEQIKVEEYSITRGRQEYRKATGNMDFRPEYTFSK